MRQTFQGNSNLKNIKADAEDLLASAGHVQCQKVSKVPIPLVSIDYFSKWHSIDYLGIGQFYLHPGCVGFLLETH